MLQLVFKCLKYLALYVELLSISTPVMRKSLSFCVSNQFVDLMNCPLSEFTDFNPSDDNASIIVQINQYFLYIFKLLFVVEVFYFYDAVINSLFKNILRKFKALILSLQEIQLWEGFGSVVKLSILLYSFYHKVVQKVFLKQALFYVFEVILR